jgi:hypothetical protein
MFFLNVFNVINNPGANTLVQTKSKKKNKGLCPPNKKNFFCSMHNELSKFERFELHSIWYTSQPLQLSNTMSTLTFSFSPSALPAQYQAAFMARFLQLALDYEILTAPVPSSPAADEVPPPSSFVPFEGDGADGEVPPVPATASVKPPRKNPWASLTEEQRTERLAALKRGREARAAARRVSEDSLAVPPTEAVAELPPTRTPNNGGVNLGRFDAPPLPPSPEAAAAEDAVSETSSKKARKNPWAGLTPEQHAVKVATMRAAREAKKAERAAAASAAATGV